ncbi:MAG: malate/lactate/ureidoglycolate dehydrogenase [Rubrivivax sp.]
MTDSASVRRIDHEVLRRYVRGLFEASGSLPDEAGIVADHLVDANLRGHDSHGSIRAAKYIGWVEAGQLLPNRHADVVSDRGALMVVDGGFGYGQVIGRQSMQLAIERARSFGFCALGIRNTGHLGRVGAWAEQLAEANLVSFHFVNTSGFGILVAPHGGSDRRLSANPMAAGVPLKGKAPLILDVATSSIAEGKIQVARNRGEQLATGMVIDGMGQPTTDPERFYASPPGAIFPFGGHKGSGLSFMCEVLAGSLTGGASSHPDNPTASRLVNNMLTMAFDPAAFPTDQFDADVTRLTEWTKASPPIEPGGEVLLPGEIEARTMVDRLARGIPMDAQTLGQLGETARRLGVPVPKELHAALH